jgi:hypothetical protein
MTLHPKIKMIAEEFGESYEWIAGDGSLFIKVSPQFLEIIKEKLENSPLEFVSSKQKAKSYYTSLNENKFSTKIIPAITTLWYRLPEEQEKNYDFEDEDDE